MSDLDYTNSKEYGDLMDHLYNGATIYEKGFFSWIGRRDNSLEEFKERALKYVEEAEADVVKLRELVEALV
jgi:hypothetical protein